VLPARAVLLRSQAETILPFPLVSLHAFRRRGKGLLAIASSNWQLLGASLTPASPEWAVTYFSKTLFTPVGLDIYARGANGLTDEQVDAIVKAIESLGGDVAALVKNGGMFRIPQAKDW